MSEFGDYQGIADEELLAQARESLERSACGPRPTNGRRSRAQIQAIRTIMRVILANENPMTVRQMFYRLVSEGVIQKTETEYKATVVRLLGEMRRDGEIPYSHIADNTRWMRKPRTYSSLEAMLAITAQTYRRSIWLNHADYVEVWLEKDALAGVVYEVTAEWDVPLMVTRGYPSLTFLHSASETITEWDRPARLYYFGDRDPSGVDIPRKVENTLREMAPDAEIHFDTIAVTEDQIEEFDLPTRPTKRSDTRSKAFEGESVELDAIPPEELRSMVRECIAQHLDPELLAATERIEAEERSTLARLAFDPEGLAS
jgi:hypothetical protein